MESNSDPGGPVRHLSSLRPSMVLHKFNRHLVGRGMALRARFCAVASEHSLVMVMSSIGVAQAVAVWAQRPRSIRLVNPQRFMRGERHLPQEAPPSGPTCAL